MNPTPAIQPASLSRDDWDKVHAEVQSILERLAVAVRSRCPSVRVRTGRTSGRVWFLYTHLDFNLTEGSDVEETVVGISFSPGPDAHGILVNGDIGGGETGITDHEVPDKVVPADLTAVLSAAREVAEDLCRQDEIVAKALAERRLPPNYRAGLV